MIPALRQSCRRWRTDLAGLRTRPRPVRGTGQGIAFARYENTDAYVATAADVSVDPGSGKITLNHIDDSAGDSQRHLPWHGKAFAVDSAQPVTGRERSRVT